MAFTCSLSDMSWLIITPRFLTLMLGFILIPASFYQAYESIITLEHFVPVPAVKNSVFSSLSLRQLLNIQHVIKLCLISIHMKQYEKHSDDYTKR